MVYFRTKHLAYSNLAPPDSLNIKLDWRQPDKSQPSVNTRQEHQLVAIGNRGRGNCFFACIAQAVYGNENDHQRVRAEVMNFYLTTMITGYQSLNAQQQLMMVYAFGKLTSNALSRQEFANFVIDWVDKMQGDGECCSEIDINVAAFIYRIQIIVLKYSHKEKYVYDDRGVPCTDKRHNIRTEPEGPMGSFITDASSANLNALLGPKHPRLGLQEIPGVCAAVQPIMIYNEYIPGEIRDVLSRGPATDSDEGGHYTLLIHAPSGVALLNPASNVAVKPCAGARNNGRTDGEQSGQKDMQSQDKCLQWCQNNTTGLNANATREAHARAALLRFPGKDKSTCVSEEASKRLCNEIRCQQLCLEIDKQHRKMAHIEENREKRTVDIQTRLRKALEERLAFFTQMHTLEIHLIGTDASASDEYSLKELRQHIEKRNKLIVLYQTLPCADAKQEQIIKAYLQKRQRELECLQPRV